MTAWNPTLYLQFGDERTRPAEDLLARVALEQPQRIVDLGCGPGNSTALLRRRWPTAYVVGLDNSQQMIDRARQDAPDGTWLLADVHTWAADEPFDLVYSNATLHWLPDHAALFPRLFGQVAPGGALAVQMPANGESPAYRLIRALADDPVWSDRMAAARSAARIETPSLYYDVLCPLASRIDLWETTYYHVLGGPPAIIDWVRGTGLRPYLNALDADEQQEFLARLLDGLISAYPRQVDGNVLFAFKRLFLVAYR